MATKVWVVQQDETPDNTILGIFDNPDDARAFAMEVAPQFPDHVITMSFPVPFRAGTGRRAAPYLPL